jgi:thioredoxin 1
MRELTDIEFKEQVYDYESQTTLGERPILADLYTSWCTVCNKVNPLMDRLRDKYKDKIDFIKVNISTADSLVNALDVQGVPTLLFFRPGVSKPQRITGIPSTEKVEKLISEYLL